MEESKNNIEENNINSEEPSLVEDNINSMNQEFATENVNNEELEEEEEEEEEIDPSKEIALLFDSLVEMYSKKQFKKILKTIVVKADKEEKFNLMEWKLLFIRTQTLQKIMERKNTTYYKSMTIPHYSEYIQKVNNDINHWIPFIQELLNLNELTYANSFSEFLILFLLKKCLILSKYHIHFGHIKDSIAICSLAMRLIMKTFNFFKSPDSFQISAEILLNLSSFLIAEENYETAKNLINHSIKFSYMSLELKLFKNGINYRLFNLKDYKNEIPQLSKLFFNLSVSFYQLGICFENEEESYNAFYSMKTAKFFLNILKDPKVNLFLDLVKRIEERLLMRSRIVIFFEKCVKKEELEEKEIKIKKVYNKLSYLEERRRRKFNKIKEKVEKLKLVEVDDDEPDLFNRIGQKPINENVLKSTKQLFLLEYLMSDDFKDVIQNMKKIEINKLEKDTINKIQKKIVYLKNNEREKQEKQNKKILNLIRKLENTKKEDDEIKKEKEKEMNQKPLIKNKNKNKSNTYISSSIYNSFTTSNTKKPRISSAYNVNHKSNLLTYNNNLNQSNKTLKTYNEKPKFNDSLYTSPSRYLSLHDNGSITRKKTYLTRDRILNGKRSQIYNQKYINQNISEKKNKSVRQKNLRDIIKSKAENMKIIPRYNYNNYYFNKRFRKKYNFLENQYDRELAFQKQLLKSKNIKGETGKPESISIKDIHKSVDRFYFTTFQNELMNAKEKQIIFNKIQTIGHAKKFQRKVFYTESRQYSPISLNKEFEYLSPNQIYERNDDCINEITNKISKIITKEKEIEKKRRNNILK